ncbi:MAG: energy-coupling factor transporter transmembrane component T [Erysipelotrichaceae bacterium]
MNNIALGRYIPLNSFMHKIDPRAKIIAMIILLIAIFIPASFYGYAIIAAIVLLATILSKLNLNFIWKSMKPMMFMLAFLCIINMFMIRTGDIAFSILSFNVYSDAISQTLYIVIRLTLMIVITTILTATTKPMSLTLGIEDLLSPLKVIKVPASEIAMMISIALRFIPTLIEETQRIMKAQASRGVDLQEGSIKEKLTAIISLIVPLFVSAFQKATDLADAMEARGYIPGEYRTRYKVLKMKLSDYMIILLAIGVLSTNIILMVYVI